MSPLVVRWNGDVNELERSICVTQRNDGNVNIRGFTNSLVVSAGICDNDETRFLERSGDVVCERARSETASNRLCASVRGELEDSTVPVWSCADYDNVFWGNWSDNSCGENELLPGFPNINQMDT